MHKLIGSNQAFT